MSFDEVCIEVNNDIGTRTANGVDQLFPNRCNQNDFAIAHSQGGLAGRHLDRYWDLQNSTYGSPKYFGLVTFATPHSGADIALTRESHKEFVQQAVSAVILDPVNNGAYNLTNKVGFLFGVSAPDLLNNLDTLIKNQLTPLMLSPVHTPTLDEMIPNGQQMNAINNHQSRLRKAAFYGVESAPECWKVMTNLTDTASEDYPLWGAQPDHYFEDRMEKVRDEHVARIKENRDKLKSLKAQANTPIWGLIRAILGVSKQIGTLQENTNHRQAAVDFLNNANTEWRYLIGSYHKDSFEYIPVNKYKVTWYQRGYYDTSWYTQSRNGFDSQQAALDYYNSIRLLPTQKRYPRVSLYATNATTKVLKFFPSDGVVLAKSQKAFPGVGNRTDKMRENNHFQERNSRETLRVMENLYDGFYDPFFQVDKR